MRRPVFHHGISARHKQGNEIPRFHHRDRHWTEVRIEMSGRTPCPRTRLRDDGSRRLPIQLFPQFFLDDLPAVFGMGDEAPRAVLHSGRKDREVTWAGKQKERAVTKQAGVPVLQVVTGQKFAFEIDETFIMHLFCRSFLSRFSTFSHCSAHNKI